MLLRSFGASSFEAFWRYWNPIFGYFLGRYVYSPLRRVLPAALALVITFLVCGALHDLVTMAVRGSWAFLFTPWFLFLSVGVLVSRATHMNISRLAWPVRATTHVAYLAVGLALAVVLKNALAL
jgi:D-alanyl-lipoteichoic acid acyltransferase DltB (MBOAT superfamily)